MTKTFQSRQKVKIGLVTIGQSPREDIVSEMRNILGGNIEILQSGALDGLTRLEINRLQPRKTEFPLLTRLNDGTSVIVGKKKIVPLLNQRIADLEHIGTVLIALLCTEEFEGLISKQPLVLPWNIMQQTIDAIHPAGKLGILIPMEEQQQAMQKKWGKTGVKFILEPVNPYEDRTQLKKRLMKLCEEVELVVLDCFGYNSKFQNQIYSISKKPVILPQTIVAEYIKGMIIGSDKK